MEKTHWKKQFNYDYLGAYSLPNGQEVVLTMKGTTKEMIVGNNGKKESAFVCYFQEKEDWVKPMILNRTNCKTIEKIYGTPFIEEWAGKQITIFIQPGIQAFGDIVDGLRIRNKKPSPPELTEIHPSYSSVVDFLKGGGDLKRVTDKYVVSPALLITLKNLIPKKEE